MADSTEARYDLAERLVGYLEEPVAAGETIQQGVLVMANQSGYCEPGADTSNAKYLGVAAQKADNASGSDGDVKVMINRPRYLEVNYASPTQALLGDIITISDDHTGSTGGNVVLGQCVHIVDTSADGKIVVDTHVKALS